MIQRFNFSAVLAISKEEDPVKLVPVYSRLFLVVYGNMSSGTIWPQNEKFMYMSKKRSVLNKLAR